MQDKNKQTNYSLSIFFTALMGLGLIIPLFVLHYFDIPAESITWAIDIMAGMQFVSTLVSGNGYFFQLIDKLFHNTTVWNRIKERAMNQSTAPKTEFTLEVKKTFKNNPATFIGLAVGVAGAVALTVVDVVKHVPIVGSIVHIGQAVRTGLGFIWNLSMCGGLGNRVGRTVDIVQKPEKQKSLGRSKNINYALSIIGGIVIGIVLAALVIHTAGAALPAVLLAVSAVGSSASASGYVGRVCDFLLGNRTMVHAVKDVVKPNSPIVSAGVKPAVAPANRVDSIRKRATKESALTTVGVGAGLVLGVILVVAGVATLPFFGLGSAKILAGILLISSCVSVCGGLGNRIGHFWDKFRTKKKATIVAAAEDEVVQSIPPSVSGESNLVSPSHQEVRQESYHDITETLQEQRFASDMPLVVEKPNDKNIVDQASTLPEHEPSKTGKNYSCKMAPKFTMFKPSIQELQKPDEQFLEMPTHHSYAAVAA